VIAEVLAAGAGNKTAAARRLGSTRPTPYARMRTYRSWPGFTAPPGAGARPASNRAGQRVGSTSTFIFCPARSASKPSVRMSPIAIFSTQPVVS
jgi:hypothetical protein